MGANIGYDCLGYYALTERFLEEPQRIWAQVRDRHDCMTARSQKRQIPVKLGHEIVQVVYALIENDNIETIGVT